MKTVRVFLQQAGRFSSVISWLSGHRQRLQTAMFRVKMEDYTYGRVSSVK